MCPGFFGRMFKKEPAVVRAALEDLPLLLEKGFLLQKGEIEDFAAKKIAEVKYLHARTSGLLKVISQKELESKANERMNRAALTSKKQLVQQLAKLLEKLDPKERGASLSDARHYAGESSALLANEIVSLRKNIAYTSFYLKEDMKALGEALQAMANLFHEMNTKFRNAGDLFEFEKVRKMIREALDKRALIRKLASGIASLQEKAAQKEKLAGAEGEKVRERKEGSEMAGIRKAEEEMAGLLNQKQELKTEIGALLLNIDRPLQRFKQLVDSGRWKLPREEKEMLELFITNPMFALKKDPKADVFKGVLGEVVAAVEDGSIELKEKEKEKRLGALQEIINFDFFGSVFWKMNEIQKKQAELNRLLEKSETKKEIEGEERAVGGIKKEAAELREEIAQEERRVANLEKELAAELVVIKEFAQGVLKKTVVFEEGAY